METNLRGEQQETRAFSCADTSTCADTPLADGCAHTGVSHVARDRQMTHPRCCVRGENPTEQLR